MNEYVRKLTALANRVPTDIIPSWDPPSGKIRVPTQAFSEFLINRELGDWAEDLVKRAINSAGLGLEAVRYGRSERLVAGEPGFKEYYNEYIKELRTYGKRPDLLLWRNGAPAESEIEGKTAEVLIPVAQSAIAAVEVRSSQQSLTGARTEDDLSFTPKVEDVANVMRWVKQHGVKHYYAQVIFGAVYGISFEQILELLVVGPRDGGYSIEREPRNQFKSTIYIPLSRGLKLSTRFQDPELSAFERELSSGRVLFGVAFSGGHVEFDPTALTSLLTH
jgi:hypothetical protein